MLELLWLACKVGLGLLVCNALAVIAYRLKFHALATYPGPWLAKVTDLYAAYYSVLGQTHTQIYELHRRHGPIVRLGPSKLSFDSATALHEVYTSKQVQKSKGYLATATNQHYLNTVHLIDKPAHRRKRRLLSQAFSEQALRRFEPVLIGEINVFIKELSETLKRDSDVSAKYSAPEKSDRSWSSPVDVGLRFRYLMVDVIAQFGFGQSLAVQTSPKNRFFMDAICAASFRAGVYAQYAKLRKYAFDKIVAPFQKSLWHRFLALNRSLVTARLQDTGTDHNDVFSFLINAKDPNTGQGLSPPELFAESGLFFIAGTDTTAAALSSTLFYLSRHPTRYERLVSDIRHTFAHLSAIRNGPALGRLAYLRACIDEALRMSPPVGAALWRETCAPDGADIAGVHVPPGIDVGASIFVVHHDDAIFPDPFAYRPERWMLDDGGDGEEQQRRLERMRWAFQPFSLGARNCVAKNMAYLELMIIVARLLWCFDVRAPRALEGKRLEGREEQFELQEHLTPKFRGPWLELRHRPGVEMDSCA